ncbi:MAG: hypothetical protein Greene041662_960 [Candidatus Peregrinibacteria bacterium Greene0416_62]|nr:MAG: hypothetical protein Greene041662_960 [Candidatus Peregrinibacteria bacterium Greene0416_62]TSD00206.1 MAG: hypothetical protein Greene101449_292 [Candidatus Peregrinibacteria bacterium Greene1014_49]
MDYQNVQLLHYTLIPEEGKGVSRFELWDAGSFIGILSGMVARRIHALCTLHQEQHLDMREYNCHGLTQYLLRQVHHLWYCEKWEPKHSVEISLEQAVETFRFPIGMYLSARHDTHSGLILGKTESDTLLAIHKIGTENIEFCSPEDMIAYGKGASPQFFGRLKRSNRRPDAKIIAPSTTPPAHSRP